MRLLAIVGLAVLSACSRETPPPASGAMDSTYVAQIETDIRERMKDPEAVRFRKIQIRDSGGVRTACGEFNAKNSYGGYQGYRPYVAMGTVVAISGDDGFADTTATDAYRACAGLPSLVAARAEANRRAKASQDAMFAKTASDLAAVENALDIELRLKDLVRDGNPPFVGWSSRKKLYSAFCISRHRIPEAERRLFLTEEAGTAAGYNLVSDAECMS